MLPVSVLSDSFTVVSATEAGAFFLGELFGAELRDLDKILELNGAPFWAGTWFCDMLASVLFRAEIVLVFEDGAPGTILIVCNSDFLIVIVSSVLLTSGLTLELSCEAEESSELNILLCFCLNSSIS